MVTRGKQWKREIDWESGIDMYTLLYLKQKTNKDVLHAALCSIFYNNLNRKII